jgi:addiction module HigA family antidote
MVMKNPVHPGEVLREDVLAELGLSVAEAVSRLGVSRVTLSRVLHGHARVSPSLAVRWEEAGAGTARAWLAMQVPTSGNAIYIAYGVILGSTGRAQRRASALHPSKTYLIAQVGGIGLLPVVDRCSQARGESPKSVISTA